MDTITQQLLQQLSGDDVSRIGQQIGADEQSTRSALSSAIPLLVSALAGNASQPEGAQSLHDALARDHDGSVLGNLSEFLGAPDLADGSGIIGHVLGSQQSTIAQGLAQVTGMDSAQIAQLLQIIAPLVMGVLGKQQQQQGLDPSSLSDFLGGQQQAQQSEPDLMSLLSGLLGGGQGAPAASTGSGDASLDGFLGGLGQLLGGGGTLPDGS